MYCSSAVKTLTLIAILAVPVGNPGPALSEPDPTRRLDILFEKIPHAAFEWSEASGISGRAAMRFPVDLDGTEGWLQLDTGLDATLVYGDLPADRGWETHDGMYRVPRFDIGDIRLGPAWVRSRQENGEESTLLGSLGLDLLVGHMVLIDYPHRRMALMSHGDVPQWLLQNTTWTPAELRDAKFFLNAVIGGESMDGLFFDTGASAFDIVVDFEDWVEITGCTSPEEAPTRWRVNSWGRTVTAVGAPAHGPLVIGSARIPHPLVFYLQEQPNLFSHWPFQARGLVGNAPFVDRIVILDLGIRPRFGLVQRKS